MAKATKSTIQTATFPTKSKTKNISATKALLFDFDGVLVDSFRISYESSLQSNHGRQTQQTYRKLFEGNIYDGLKKSRLVKKAGADFYYFYGPKLLLLDLAPFAGEVLKILSRQYSLFVISSTPAANIGKFFQRRRVSKYFTEILGADFHTSKVRKIGHVLSKYRLKPSDCLFITDTLGDIREARRCKVGSIALADGFHPAATLRKGKPFKIIKGLAKLPGTVEDYFKQP